MRGWALITGAGGGVGKAVANGLAECGFNLVLAGRSRDGLDALARTLDRDGLSVLVHPTDVREPDSVDSLFAAIADRSGRLDLLFNNAGVDHPGHAFEELDHERLMDILRTNCVGQFLCAQAAFCLMKQAGIAGRIINNGSVSAHVPRPGSAAYAMAKHAVTGLTRSLMICGRPYGISAGQIDIGNAAEPGRAEIGPVLQPDGRRMMEPAISYGEVAHAVRMMATLPPGANMPFVTVMPTGMPYAGRG